MAFDAYEEFSELVFSGVWPAPQNLPPQKPELKVYEYEILDGVDIRDFDAVERFQNEEGMNQEWSGGNYGGPWSTIVAMIGESCDDRDPLDRSHPDVRKRVSHMNNVLGPAIVASVNDELQDAFPPTFLSEIINNLYMVANARLLTEYRNSETEDILLLLRSRLNPFGWIGSFPENGRLAVHPF